MGTTTKTMAKGIIACLVVAVCVVQSQEEMVELASTTGPTASLMNTPGKISLLELRTQALSEARGTEVMTEEMLKSAEKNVMKLASEFQTQSIQSDSIETIRLAKKLFAHKGELGEGAGADGSGLTLIFRKLDELEAKINNEQKMALEAELASQQACRNGGEKLNQDLTRITKSRAEARMSVQELQTRIKKTRADWRDSRRDETETHNALVELQGLRLERSEGVRARVDEPHRYETKKMEQAKVEA